MASSKRDFTNFEEFPGALQEGTGLYVFPKLWYKDSSEKWRTWDIVVRLIKATDKALSGINWNLLDEKQVVIKKEYFSVGNKISKNIHAETWVETGREDGKITRSAPTYFVNPVNEGKSNERNVFQQSLIYARAQWLKRKDKGCVEERKDATAATNVNVMYFPMLARPFKDAEKNIKFPVYVQPKLDGVRCLAYLAKPNTSYKEVILYTRTKKVFPSVDYLKKILYPYLNHLYDTDNNQSIYLDGELYKHGKKLQDISGDSRNESANVSEKNTNRNEYHIYDCFYPKELTEPFKHRYQQLKVLYDSIEPEDATVLKKVPTYIVNNFDEANKKYKEFVKLGYEGAMLRNILGPYLASPDKTGTFLRSRDLVKLKPKFSDEFVVVGFKEGTRGKDKGAILWVCKTSDGIEFNVTPKDITYEQRYELYEDAVKNFDKKYADRYMTVEYEDLSKTGVPQRAKAVAFRDYE